jgi:hypothetical protein
MRAREDLDVAGQRHVLHDDRHPIVFQAMGQAAAIDAFEQVAQAVFDRRRQAQHGGDVARDFAVDSGQWYEVMLHLVEARGLLRAERTGQHRLAATDVVAQQRGKAGGRGGAAGPAQAGRHVRVCSRRSVPAGSQCDACGQARGARGRVDGLAHGQVAHDREQSHGLRQRHRVVAVQAGAGGRERRPGCLGGRVHEADSIASRTRSGGVDPGRAGA